MRRGGSPSLAPHAQTLFLPLKTNGRHYAPPVNRRLRGSKVAIWLGLSDLFQTFEDLESVVDKEAEIASIRELLGEDDARQNDEKEPLC